MYEHDEHDEHDASHPSLGIEYRPPRSMDGWRTSMGWFRIRSIIDVDNRCRCRWGACIDRSIDRSIEHTRQTLHRDDDDDDGDDDDDVRHTRARHASGVKKGTRTR